MPELGTEPEPHRSEVPPRYGFAHALSTAWALLAANAARAFGIFVAIHLLAAVLSFLILLAAPAEVAAAVIPARFVAGVLVPTFAGSIGVAILTNVLIRPDAAGGGITGVVTGTTASMATIAAAVALVAVLFLGGYGVLVLPFFYGPPIAMQIAVAEGWGVQASLASARARLRGNWHTVLYLFAVAVALGVLSVVPVGGVFSLVAERADVAVVALVSVARGVLIGIFATFVGVMQVSSYLRLRHGAEAASPGAPIPD